MNGGRRRGRMSDNERALWFCFLFPPLWPLGIAALLCMAFEAIGKNIRDMYWRFKHRNDT